MPCCYYEIVFQQILQLLVTRILLLVPVVLTSSSMKDCKSPKTLRLSWKMMTMALAILSASVI
jgi:hypothetical protein